MNDKQTEKMNAEKVLRDQIAEIELKYKPITNLFEPKQPFLKSVCDIYKGFITANNPLFQKPKVLFIGINPGQGAFGEANSTISKAENAGSADWLLYENAKYPTRNFSVKTPQILDWLMHGNAHGKHIDKKWIGQDWHKRTTPQNNSFVKRMVNFLFSYYKIQQLKDFSEIENKINSEIFYLNLYPIATKSTEELKAILKKIVALNLTLNGKKIEKIKDLKNFFRQITIDMITLLQPEVIVCLGSMTFNELTAFTQTPETRNTFTFCDAKLRTADKKKYKTYIISRRGNWESKITELGNYLGDKRNRNDKHFRSL